MRHQGACRQKQRKLGTLPARVDPAEAKGVINQFLRDSLTPEDAQDPRIRALAQWTLARAVQSVDGMQSEVLALIQDNIEKSAAARIKGGIDLGPLRPLVGHLQTGQLNAVSMRVPGRSGAYLVLFEAQMQLFASTLSEAVA